MEPVPETERMEEFRRSPLPNLRMQSPSALQPPDFDFPRKPPNLRRSTDPSPPASLSSPTSPSWASPAALQFRPRAASPLSITHTRSKSTASLTSPVMSRTQSMPGVSTGSGHLLYSPQFRPQSPLQSPSQSRAPALPRRAAMDEAYPSSPTRMSVHDPEQQRKLTERNSTPNLVLTSSTSAWRLRRPSSPLRHHVALSSTSSLPGLSTTPASSASSVASSPSYRSSSSSYYDPLLSSSGGSPAFGPSSVYYPSSSVPSTPTSTRSRSPSISSLETIPDSPDAEEAALEAERIAQLKADADAADGVGAEAKGRGSLDVPVRGRILGGFSSRDKRKRWSVCGAERRQDLDLETIWED